MKYPQQAVVVGLSGGLGNQMFQYAAGRALSMRLEVPLTLDLSWFGGQKERQFALSPFWIDAKQRTQCPNLSAKNNALISRFSRRLLPRIMGSPVWREPHFHYSTHFSSLSEPVFLEGYWQSEHYFSEIRTTLLREFSLRTTMPLACSKLIEKIHKYDAICIHVRRGDYLTNPIAAKTHGICSVDYYQAAVKELSAGLPRPHCFVFSDDPKWVKASLAFSYPMTIVDINGPNDAHLDLILMAACNHFIIANSSLSWWSAWLGNHAQKKVIAPDRWFLTSNKDTRDLLPETWQRR